MTRQAVSEVDAWGVGLDIEGSAFEGRRILLGRQHWRCGDGERAHRTVFAYGINCADIMNR